MGRASTFALYDRLLDGRLGEILKTYRAEGLSYFEITRRLSADHEIDITTETARRWLHSLSRAA